MFFFLLTLTFLCMTLFKSAFYMCIVLCGSVYVRRVVPTVCQNRKVTLCHVEIEQRLTKIAVARAVLNKNDCTDVK